MPLDQTSNEGLFLLTHFGTVICHRSGVDAGIDEATNGGDDGDTLFHRPILEALRDGVALAVRGNGLALDLPGICGSGVRVRTGGMTRLRIVPTVRPGVIALQDGDQYLCVYPRKTLEKPLERPPAVDVSKVGPWECLVPLTRSQLELLGRLLEGQWIGDDGIPRSFRIEEHLRLMHGDVEFSLYETFGSPFGEPAVTPSISSNRIVLWRNGWQPHCFTRFRPLVYFAAFGEGAVKTLVVALRSLERIGAYEGDVLVITDLPHEALVELCLPGPGLTLHSWQVRAAERFDMFNARYMIGAWERARDFGPFLYLDTDIVTDRPIGPVLRDLVGLEGIACQEEMDAGLETHESVGSSVIEEDARLLTLREGRCGVNSGLIGFWDIERAAFVFRMVIDTIYRHAHAARRRDALTHYDQALMNYVLLLHGGLDTTILTPRVALYFLGAHRPNAVDNHHRERALDDRRGFVHFWGADDKAARMREYLDYLSSVGA